MNTTIETFLLVITRMFYTRLFSAIWTGPETGHYLSYQTKTQPQARADILCPDMEAARIWLYEL